MRKERKERERKGKAKTSRNEWSGERLKRETGCDGWLEWHQPKTDRQRQRQTGRYTDREERAKVQRMVVHRTFANCRLHSAI